MEIKGKISNQEHEELDAIVKAIIHTTEVDEIYLFGSYAQGTSTPASDFDLYVVIPDDSIRPLIVRQQIRQEIQPFQKRPVDLLVNKRSQFLSRKNSNTFIEKEVALNGIKIYG